MAKAASSVQKDFLNKEANLLPSKTQAVAEKPQEIKKKIDGILVGGPNSSVQPVASPNVNRSSFTFNSSNLQCKNGDDETLEYDSSIDNASASSFDFHKDRAGNRPPIGPLSKPAPSKWDDAEKWLVGVSSVESTPLKIKPKGGNSLQVPQVQNSQPTLNSAKKAQTLVQVRQSCNAGGGHAPRPAPAIGAIAANSSESLEIAPLSERIKSEGRENFTISPTNASGELMKKVETNKYISDQGEGAAKFSFVASETDQHVKPESLPNAIDHYPLDDAFDCGEAESKDVPIACISNDHEMLKPTLRTQKPTTEFPTSNSITPNLNNCKNSDPLEASYLPPTSVKSVSMRDMGTEMTPIASQEPSRTGTPNRATTPNLGSPVSSRPSTPGRAAPTPSPMQQTTEVNVSRKESESKVQELSEKELQAKTRQEILALGMQLGKANIRAWATREEEDSDASKSLKNIDLEEVKKNVLETRVAAWEEAEKAKYVSRYKREEAKIQAWENHEKAKAEAEMRRIEVKVEKMHSNSYERFMNKLVATRRRSEEMLAIAEVRRGEQAAKTARRADFFRRTGKMPSSFSFCSFCW